MVVSGGESFGDGLVEPVAPLPSLAHLRLRTVTRVRRPGNLLVFPRCLSLGLLRVSLCVCRGLQLCQTVAYGWWTPDANPQGHGQGST